VREAQLAHLKKHTEEHKQMLHVGADEPHFAEQIKTKVEDLNENHSVAESTVANSHAVTQSVFTRHHPNQKSETGAGFYTEMKEVAKSKRPLTANHNTTGLPRVHSAMTTGIQKKFGFQPSEILRGTNIDVVSFIGAGGSMKEEHTKLFSRIDVLVER
jgi:hypothetical protein